MKLPKSGVAMPALTATVQYMVISLAMVLTGSARGATPIGHDDEVSPASQATTNPTNPKLMLMAARDAVAEAAKVGPKDSGGRVLPSAYRRAVKLYQEAYDAAISNRDIVPEQLKNTIQSELGWITYKTYDPVRGENLLEEVVTRDPSDTWAIVALSIIRFNNIDGRRTNKALDKLAADLDGAILSNPENPDAHYMRAIVAGRLGQRDIMMNEYRLVAKYHEKWDRILWLDDLKRVDELYGTITRELEGDGGR